MHEICTSPRTVGTLSRFSAAGQAAQVSIKLKPQTHRLDPTDLSQGAQQPGVRNGRSCGGHERRVRVSVMQSYRFSCEARSMSAAVVFVISVCCKTSCDVFTRRCCQHVSEDSTKGQQAVGGGLDIGYAPHSEALL